jgi:hypothetical protein
MADKPDQDLATLGMGILDSSMLQSKQWIINAAYNQRTLPVLWIRIRKDPELLPDPDLDP